MLTGALLDDLMTRRVVSSEDRPAWIAARTNGVTGSEMKRIRSGSAAAWQSLINEKLQQTDRELRVKAMVWGRLREDELTLWASRRWPVTPSRILFHAAGNPRHLATPDGYGAEYDWDAETEELIAVEAKTGKHDVDPATSPLFDRYGYYDQCQWEMWVLGAARCLFLWEQHDDDWSEWPDRGPEPLTPEPHTRWVLRDDDRIAELVTIADRFLEALDAAREGREERDVALDGLIARYLEAKEEAGAAETDLREYLDERGLDTHRVPALASLSYRFENASTRFNSRQFQVDHPGLYAEYMQVGAPPAKKTLRVTPVKEK